MAPKKKGGKKGKKGKGEGPAGVPLTSEELNADLENQLLILERELQLKEEACEAVRAEEAQLRAKVEELEKDFEDEKNNTFAVTADMARQYKALQEELIHKINSLETTLTEQKEELDLTNHELKELVREKDEEIKARDVHIQELKKRMDEMAHEFAEMLTKSLEVMKKNMASKILDGTERELKPAFTQKLQDYAYATTAVAAQPSGGGGQISTHLGASGKLRIAT
ncbi:unnamed protein product [Vitrella brassicaformis CCMP3155]|uniref:Dynein regulatory complex protein 12 n=1 Tax=Vitrella brassicaformis (strain CCMP3155) TaxID=1169540 RepID=A0A0G4FVH5_VITBC|nr:unnamed protein product [Vitrella brassicaformis CCMP3155]|eukprot:CEM19219.1 unnamed protein product [Vitrella brassicaformis CCMP3155]